MSEERKQKGKAADDLVDIDYWDKLSETERAWLNEFVQNHYYAFPNPNASKDENRENYRRSWYIRQDIYNRSSQSPLYDKNEATTNPEEAVVEFIDYSLLDQNADGEEQ